MSVARTLRTIANEGVGPVIGEQPSDGSLKWCRMSAASSRYNVAHIGLRWTMPTIQLSAVVSGNGYQAVVAFPDGVTFNSAETYPTIAEAMMAAALKILEMPERLEALDRPQRSATS